MAGILAALLGIGIGRIHLHPCPANRIARLPM
jgi:hypothetical protein